MKALSADGQEGMLIYTGEDYYFRVYNSVGDWDDYRICHSDLNIVIKDQDAYFFTDSDGEKWLDHSPETLGFNNE